jgi:hypothetical protein
VLGGGGGEVEFKADGGGVEQPHGGERGLEDGDVFRLGFLEYDAGWVDVAGENKAGDAMLEEFLEALAADVFRKGLKVLGLAAADDLDALEGKGAIESGECEAGAIDGTLGDAALQAAGSGEQFELQLTGVVGVELSDGDVGIAGFRHEGRIGLGHADESNVRDCRDFRN